MPVPGLLLTNENIQALKNLVRNLINICLTKQISILVYKVSLPYSDCISEKLHAHTRSRWKTWQHCSTSETLISLCASAHIFLHCFCQTSSFRKKNYMNGLAHLISSFVKNRFANQFELTQQGRQVLPCWELLNFPEPSQFIPGMYSCFNRY